MTDYAHLFPSSAEWLDLPVEERIFEMKKDVWFGYPVATQALQALESLLAHPKIARMPNLLIIGRTNNGKSHILNRFCQLHPASDNLDGGAVSVPVLKVQAPSGADERSFYSDILDGIFAKYGASSHPRQLLAHVKDKFRKIGVRMLVIDEFHNLVVGTSLKQRHFLTVLKHLSNELQIPFVAAGTEDAGRAMQVDPQLSNRFKPFVLPRWSMDAEFRRMMMSWEKFFPLRYPSGLSDKALATDIWSRTDGTIGEAVLLIKAAAELAIRNGHERIDKEMLDKCGYQSAAERKKRMGEV